MKLSLPGFNICRIAKAYEIVLCCPIVRKQLDHKSKLDGTQWEKLMYFNLKGDEPSFPCAFLLIDKRRTKSQVYTLMLGSRNISVYCFMGDFGCGSGGWTLVMKTDGTKVKERTFAEQLLLSFQKIVSFYFLVKFSKELQLHFLLFAWNMYSDFN